MSQGPCNRADGGRPSCRRWREGADGRRREFDAYFRARRDAVRRTAYLLCGDWHRADDHAQAAFVALHRHWRRIRDRAALDAWMRRTLVRTVVDESRRPWRRERSTEDPVATTAVADRADGVATRHVLVDGLRSVPPAPARRAGAAVPRGAGRRGDRRGARVLRGHREEPDGARAGRAARRARRRAGRPATGRLIGGRDAGTRRRPTRRASRRCSATRRPGAPPPAFDAATVVAASRRITRAAALGRGGRGAGGAGGRRGGRGRRLSAARGDATVTAASGQAADRGGSGRGAASGTRRAAAAPDGPGGRGGAERRRPTGRRPARPGHARSAPTGRTRRCGARRAGAARGGRRAGGGDHDGVPSRAASAASRWRSRRAGLLVGHLPAARTGHGASRRARGPRRPRPAAPCWSRRARTGRATRRRSRTASTRWWPSWPPGCSDGASGTLVAWPPRRANGGARRWSPPRRSCCAPAGSRPCGTGPSPRRPGCRSRPPPTTSPRSTTWSSRPWSAAAATSWRRCRAELDALPRGPPGSTTWPSSCSTSCSAASRGASPEAVMLRYERFVGAGRRPYLAPLMREMRGGVRRPARRGARRAGVHAGPPGAAAARRARRRHRREQPDRGRPGSPRRRPHRPARRARPVGFSHVIPNVLAARYASPELVALWSPENKIVLERRLWIAVLRAQRDLGVDVPEQAIADYERVVEQVDLASIAARERVTRHDVKARIEEFCALAGHEHVHKGMTSRDLTENVEQLQIRLSLEHVRDRTVGAARPARPPRRRARRAGAGRAQPQRRRPGHHAGQAVRDGRRRAARRVRAAGGPARPLPAARDQGPGRHGAGHARPARRRRRQARRAGGAGRRAPRLRGRVHQRRPGLPAVAGLRRAHRAGPARPPRRRRWP